MVAMVAKTFTVASAVAVSAEQPGRAANSELAANAQYGGTFGVCWCHWKSKQGEEKNGTDTFGDWCAYVEETGDTYTAGDIHGTNSDLYRAGDKSDEAAALHPVTSPTDYNDTSGHQTTRASGEKWIVPYNGKKTGPKAVVEARQYNLCCDDARKGNGTWRYSNCSGIQSLGACKSGCDQS